MQTAADPIAQQIVQVEPVAIIEQPATKRRKPVYQSLVVAEVEEEVKPSPPPTREAYRSGVVFSVNDLRKSN